tara:strand:- start:2721 stop:3062 length:342 start_codon:yes stop_codon:yes gene_type:complete
MRKHERALNCFENVYRSNRNHLDALFHTGVELAQLDRHEKAIVVFDKVLTKFGRNINVVYAKARSKAALNEIEESLSLLKEAAKQSKMIKTWAREDEIFGRFIDDSEFESIIR